MKKSFKDIVREAVEKPRSVDAQRFIDKHIVDKIDNPVPQDEPYLKKMKQAKRDADMTDGEDEIVYEEMSDAQMKKREEIVKSMKKNQAELKDRYGDKWKDVMYATATKQAMKEGFESVLEESVSQGSVKLNDGSTVNVSKEDASALTALFKELNGANKKKMEDRMMADKKGYGEILAFAKEAM